MSNKVKDIDIKSRTYYFFDDIINIKIFDLSHIKIDEKPYKNILIYDIGFIRVCGGEFRHLALFDYGLFDKICD